MIVPTEESIEALGGVFHGEYHWPLADGEDSFWTFRCKEPQMRHDCHLKGRVIVYSLPTKTAWPKLSRETALIYRFQRDDEGYVVGTVTCLSDEEVAEYRASRGHLAPNAPKRNAA